MLTSISIPRVARITEDRALVEVLIAITFEQQKVGRVSRVYLILNKSSPEWFSAYVHIDKWYGSSKARAIRRRLENSMKGRIYYAPNKHWFLSKNMIPPPSCLTRSPKN